MTRTDTLFLLSGLALALGGCTSAGSLDESSWAQQQSDDDDAAGPTAEDALTDRQQEALNWAAAISALDCSRLVDLTRDVGVLAAPVGTDVCPSLTTTLDSGPVWFGSCPWSFDPWSGTCDGAALQQSVTGGCTMVDGTTVDGSLDLEEGAADLIDVALEHATSEGAWGMTGQAFSRTAPFQPASTWLGAVDGVVAGTTSYSSIGDVYFDESSACSWSADLAITLEGGSLDALEVGTTTLALSGGSTGFETLDEATGSQTGATRLVEGGASLLVDDGQLETSMDLEWAEEAWFDRDDSGSTGCKTEPLGGSLQVDAFDAPGGALLYQLEVVFDGADPATCDGCGTLYRDGLEIGQTCGGWDL